MSDTYALAAMMGFDSSDDFEFILMAIPKLDNIYLEHAYGEAEKKRKSQQKSAANKPPARRGRG
jgi:hypothetical protein